MVFDAHDRSSEYPLLRGKCQILKGGVSTTDLSREFRRRMGRMCGDMGLEIGQEPWNSYIKVIWLSCYHHIDGGHERIPREAVKARRGRNARCSSICRTKKSLR